MARAGIPLRAIPNHQPDDEPAGCSGVREHQRGEIPGQLKNQQYHKPAGRKKAPFSPFEVLLHPQALELCLQKKPKLSYRQPTPQVPSCSITKHSKTKPRGGQGEGKLLSYQAQDQKGSSPELPLYCFILTAHYIHPPVLR